MKLKEYIKKADVILLVVLIVIGLISSAFAVMSKSTGQSVIIESDGHMYGKYSLLTDAEIEVPYEAKNGHIESNVVIIKDGKVKVKSATCGNQVCVKHSQIDEAGESIICLPNKMVVRIEGKGGDGYDSISS